MPRNHRKVIERICNCRTAASGVAVYGCTGCGERKSVYLGCGNRHCPNCQQQKSQQWLQRAMANQLPGAHFMITFTVPEELRRFIRSNQTIAYNALFSSSADALKGALANRKYCGTDRPGFFGVLHTWTRQLEYHPHIHYVVPAGGLDRQTGLWKTTRQNYCVPQKVLATLIKAKFRDDMQRHGLIGKIPRKVWNKKWIVDVEAVGSNTEGILKYLATYVFRVAISDNRIVAVKDGMVTFKYTPSGTRQTRTTTLPALEFIRRFLQHVLPHGFMKVRYYGFMGSGCPIDIEEVSAMVRLANIDLPLKPPPVIEKNQSVEHCCEACGKPLVLLEVWHGDRLVHSRKEAHRQLAQSQAGI